MFIVASAFIMYMPILTVCSRIFVHLYGTSIAIQKWTTLFGQPVPSLRVNLTKDGYGWPGLEIIKTQVYGSSQD